MKQRSRRPKRKDTKVPQPSGPTNNVVDEAFNEEMDESLVRVATTASSLEAEQDNGSGPRPQHTMGDTIARTRFENMSKTSNDSLLAGVNTPRSDEDRLKLNELMEFCTKLQQIVLDQENTKIAQAQEITSLKLREDASKQGRKIDDIDKDAEITLVHETLGRYGDEEIFDTSVLDGDEEKSNVVEEPSESITTTPTLTTTTSIIVIAASTRPKAKRLVIHEKEQATTPTVSSQQPS
ncbi:hypothetical protein Tco_0638423 [Tanacetum coccineum]